MLALTCSHVCVYHPPELPQQHVWIEEEILADQEDPEAQQIKEEVEEVEVCSSHEEEQFQVELESDTYMLIPPYEESDDAEPEAESDQQLYNSDVDQEDAELQQIKEEQEEEAVCSRHVGGQTDVKLETDTFVFIPPYEESDDQLCDQERNYSLDQEEPEPPKVKGELEEVCTSLEGERLEPNTFMLTPTCEESDHTEPEHDEQLFLNDSHVAESQDQDGGGYEDSGSARNPAPERHSPNLSESNSNAEPGKKSLQCDTCGKEFHLKSKLNRHVRIHTGKMPHSCNTCGTRFSHISTLNAHIRLHTEGKGFRYGSALRVHMKSHTGEKPYLCKTCGKTFSVNSALIRHARVHTGERPYLCKICGQSYSTVSVLAKHIRSHSGT